MQAARFGPPCWMPPFERIAAMPSAKSYKLLHEQVVARPGAEERLAALRESTLEEIGRYELRQASEQAQIEMTAAKSMKDRGRSPSN